MTKLMHNHKSDADFVLDVAKRLRKVPVSYGLNGLDIDSLADLSSRLRKTSKPKIAIGNYTITELRVGRSCETEHAILVPADDLETDEEQTEWKLAAVAVPDNGSTEEVLAAVLECACAWVPEARIIGNVRAGDIARAVADVLAAPARSHPMVADDLQILHRETTPEGGVIRLSKWPEGYVLWYHGEIVWRSWANGDRAKAALRRSLHEMSSPPGTQIRTAECDGEDAVPVTGKPPVGTASTPARYEARENVVHKLPVKTPGDGGTWFEVGFPVCTVSEYVEAATIAAILDEYERAAEKPAVESVEIKVPSSEMFNPAQGSPKTENQMRAVMLLHGTPEQKREALDIDAKALEAVEAIFADLRDRRFLKWLFNQDGDANLIGRFDDGEELRGIDLEAQGQIKAAWQVIIAKALAATEGRKNG